MLCFVFCFLFYWIVLKIAESSRRDSYVEELRRLEDHYAKVKNEYDKLLFRNEKKNLSESSSSNAAASQEMRDLIRSLQNQNNLLKNEISRARTKCDGLRVALQKVNPDDVALKTIESQQAETLSSATTSTIGDSQGSSSSSASTSTSVTRSASESEMLATIKQLREDLR